MEGQRDAFPVSLPSAPVSSWDGEKNFQGGTSLQILRFVRHSDWRSASRACRCEVMRMVR